MKNKFTVLFVLGLILFVVLGCGFGNMFGSKDEAANANTSSNTASDDKSGDSTTSSSGEVVEVGIPECDELATYINNNSEAIGNESIVVRGIVEMYKQTIFSNLRDSVKNMNEEEKKKMGENCKKALDNLKQQMEKKGN